MMTPALAPIFAKPVAHRGKHDTAKGVIENTRSAFATALAQGFGIECDIQPSADGEAMVFHDHTLDRLTEGSGLIDGLSAANLKALAFKHCPDRMQTLSELLTQVDGAEPLVVEVKSRFDGNTSLCTRIAALVRDYTGPLALKSFDPAMLVALRKAGVKQPLGIVAMAQYDYPDFAHLSAAQKLTLAHLLHFNESRPDFLSWHHRDLPSAAPFLCRSELGLPVMSWTIRSPEEASRAAPHVDQIVFEGFDP